MSDSYGLYYAALQTGEGYLATVINALPFTITVAGNYVLASDLTTTGHGIIIQASNVTIDFAGHTISGPAAADNQFYGVVAFDFDDITVRNGSIRGFFYGIYLSDLVDSKSSAAALDGGGHLIEDMDISGATFRGIRVEGQNNVVRDNLIHDIGGTIVYQNPYAMGIETFGLNALIDSNVIRDVRGGGTQDIGEGVGISVSRSGNGTILSDNIITNASSDVDTRYDKWPAQSRSTYGIWVGGDGSEDIHVNGNVVHNFVYGITFKRTVFGDFADNAVTNALVPYYLPLNDGERVLDNGENISDISAGQPVFGRPTPGPIETVERVYLPPLPRGDGFLFLPVRNDAANADNALNGSAGLDMADYWNAAGPVTINLITNTATGGGGNDTLNSIEGAQGSKFADTIIGNAQSNLLSGAEGNDSLFGNENDDFLFGGAGNDMLYGGPGGDLLDGGEGIDYARYNETNHPGLTASLQTPASNTGAAAGDSYVSIEGLILTPNKDTGYGNASANYLYGMEGNDYLYGMQGNDTLNGGSSNDFLSGAAGNDVMTGGTGMDVFVFRAGYGHDRITDFQGAAGIVDRIDMRGLFATFADALAASAQVGPDLVITVNASTTLTIENFYRGNFAADDFLL